MSKFSRWKCPKCEYVHAGTPFVRLCAGTWLSRLGGGCPKDRSEHFHVVCLDCHEIQITDLPLPLPARKPGMTPYGVLMQMYPSEWRADHLRALRREIDRLWASMTDEQQRAEPYVADDHYRQLRAKDAAK